MQLKLIIQNEHIILLLLIFNYFYLLQMTEIILLTLQWTT